MTITKQLPIKKITITKQKSLFLGYCFLKFVCFLIIGLLVINPNNIFAQSSLGLSAIPPRLEITVNPGETITKVIKVRNESKLEKIISTDIKDFIVVDDSGTPVQVDSKDISNRWSASSWIQVSNDKLKLKPGETVSLSLTVIAPEDALPGGHYAMVLHSPQNDTFLSETGAVIQTNVGTLVYITIPGDINQLANIQEFVAPQFSEYGPIPFKTTITNLSDIHITPSATINITDLLGLKVATLGLDTVNIFPYTSRELETTLNRQLMLGRFQAKLSAAYGTNNQIVSSTIFFWVVPYRLIIAILSITIIIILIIKLIKNNKNNPKSSSPQIAELEQELEKLKTKYKDRN